MVVIINLLNKKIKNEDSNSEWESVKINSWNPEIGDKIEGKLIRIDRNSNQIIYILEKDDKRIKIWGKTYLNQLMDEINLNDYIRITYNGIKTTKNKHSMKKYDVERKVK